MNSKVVRIIHLSVYQYNSISCLILYQRQYFCYIALCGTWNSIGHGYARYRKYFLTVSLLREAISDISYTQCTERWTERGWAMYSRPKFVPRRCTQHAGPDVRECVRGMRAWSCSGLHARVHEVVVTRTWQKHAVRCDMRTPEELHAGRLWVTKYGWRERANGSKKESNSVES